MRSQLYLYGELRKKFKRPIELYKETYSNKILSVFSKIEEEAEKIADRRYRELGQYFNPDCHDEADFAEYAWNAGLDYYEGMSLIRYNTKLMWISTLYQFWEQQVRKFIFEEVTRTHQFVDKKGNEVPFKDFCIKELVI